MANWKLRKDKAPAETPGTETDFPSTDTLPAETPFLDTVPGLPEFDAADHDLSIPDHDLSSLEFGHETAQPVPADGPLTLVDYTGDETPQETHAHVYEMPSGGSVLAMPPPEHDTAFTPNTEFTPDTEFTPNTEAHDSDFETLPASSSWLSSDFSAETPTVAPFVLDTPTPAAAPAAAPQIVVRIGRLSAPFDLTKDVTTIGRPDSALHYYPDVEIEMDDAVSRRHAEIVKREDGYYLVDTGSTNGTRLNGETLLPHQESLLAHGDRVHLGDRTEITFE